MNYKEMSFPELANYVNVSHPEDKKARRYYQRKLGVNWFDRACTAAGEFRYRLYYVLTMVFLIISSWLMIQSPLNEHFWFRAILTCFLGLIALWGLFGVCIMATRGIMK